MAIPTQPRTDDASAPLSLHLQDPHGSRQLYVSDAPRNATVAELLASAVAELHLPATDATGWPVSYRARLEREGRHLNASEVLEDAVLPGDSLVITPNIEAGRA